MKKEENSHDFKEWYCTHSAGNQTRCGNGASLVGLMFQLEGEQKPGLSDGNTLSAKQFLIPVSPQLEYIYAFLDYNIVLKLV